MADESPPKQNAPNDATAKRAAPGHLSSLPLSHRRDPRAPQSGDVLSAFEAVQVSQRGLHRARRVRPVDPEVAAPGDDRDGNHGPVPGQGVDGGSGDIGRLGQVGSRRGRKARALCRS
jgi:hypothetical protein